MQSSYGCIRYALVLLGRGAGGGGEIKGGESKKWGAWGVGGGGAGRV